MYVYECVYRENVVDIQDACSITEEKKGIKVCACEYTLPERVL